MSRNFPSFQSLVVNIGETTCEMVLSSPAGVVMSRTLPVGAKSFDVCLAEHMKRTHQLVIGERTAEEIRIRIGSAGPLEPELTLPVTGRNLATGLPTTVTIDSAEFRAAIHEPLAMILESLKIILERCPPELARALEDHGILLTGIGSQLRGFDQWLSDAIKLPVRYAD